MAGPRTTLTRAMKRNRRRSLGRSCSSALARSKQDCPTHVSARTGRLPFDLRTPRRTSPPALPSNRKPSKQKRRFQTTTRVNHWRSRKLAGSQAGRIRSSERSSRGRGGAAAAEAGVSVAGPGERRATR